MIIEVRNVMTLELMEIKQVKNKKEFIRTCKKLTKKVYKCKNNEELLIRATKSSYLVKDGNYGFIVGIRKPTTSRWL